MIKKIIFLSLIILTLPLISQEVSALHKCPPHCEVKTCGPGHNITIFTQINLLDESTPVDRTITYGTNIPLHYNFFSDVSNITFYVLYEKNGLSVSDMYTPSKPVESGVDNIDSFSVPGNNNYTFMLTSFNSTQHNCSISWNFSVEQPSEELVKQFMTPLFLLGALGLLILVFYSMRYVKEARGDYVS